MRALAILLVALTLLASGCLQPTNAPQASEPIQASKQVAYRYLCPSGGASSGPGGVCSVDLRPSPASYAWPGPIRFMPGDANVALMAVNVQEPAAEVGSPLPRVQAHLWLTRDAGITWSEVSLPSLARGSTAEASGVLTAIEDLYFDEAGALHVLGRYGEFGILGLAAGREDAFHLTSKDLGASWDEPDFLDREGRAVLVSMATVGDVWAVFWFTGDSVEFVVSEDAGKTWTRTQAEPCYGLSTATRHEGRIVLVCLKGGGGAGELLALDSARLVLEKVARLEIGAASGGWQGPLELIPYGERGLLFSHTSFRGDSAWMVSKDGLNWTEHRAVDYGLRDQGWDNAFELCGPALDRAGRLHQVVVAEKRNRTGEPVVGGVDYAVFHAAVDFEMAQPVMIQELARFPLHRWMSNQLSVLGGTGCGSVAWAELNGVLAYGFAGMASVTALRALEVTPT